MCIQQHNIYRKVRSALSYLMWAELLWLIFNWISPWKLWSDANTLIVCTLPWLILFFLIRYIKRKWEEEGNASIGCLYTSTWMTVPLIIAVQLFYLWISPPFDNSKEIVYEDTHYRVTIVYGFFVTNTDFIRIDEVFGPFHREVYQSERYGIDTKKLNSTTAIEAFLKQQKQQAAD